MYKNERAFFELNSGMTKKIREKVTSSFSKNYLKFFKITQTQEREDGFMNVTLLTEVGNNAHYFFGLIATFLFFFLLFFNLKLCEMTKLKGFELSWVYRPSNKLCCQHINSLQISSLPGDTDRKFCVECNVIKTTLVKKIQCPLRCLWAGKYHAVILETCCSFKYLEPIILVHCLKCCHMLGIRCIKKAHAKKIALISM